MGREIRKILIIHNNRAREAAEQMRKVLGTQEVACFGYNGKKDVTPVLLSDTDLVISVGGDGTLLYCARLINHLGIPILGVNMGDFGFITEISLCEWQEALAGFMRGELGVSERIMVEVAVSRAGQELLREKGLNDAVIASARGSRLIKLNIAFSDLSISRYRADGIIIATPTGSTAYSLSAGGPIVHPGMEALIINPICPFTISHRPIVIPGNEEVHIEVSPDQRYDAILNIDGVDYMDLKPLDKVLVKKARKKCLIINSNKRNFYEVLKAKLNWSGEPHA